MDLILNRVKNIYQASVEPFIYKKESIYDNLRAAFQKEGIIEAPDIQNILESLNSSLNYQFQDSFGFEYNTLGKFYGPQLYIHDEFFLKNTLFREDNFLIVGRSSRPNIYYLYACFGSVIICVMHPIEAKYKTVISSNVTALKVLSRVLNTKEIFSDTREKLLLIDNKTNNSYSGWTILNREDQRWERISSPLGFWLEKVVNLRNKKIELN